MPLPGADPLNPAFAATGAPPVMEARRWLAETPPPAGLPLLNVSQAAPTEPPPEPLRAAMAEAVLHVDQTHLYGPVLGDPELRETLAARWSVEYGGQISADQVAITAGCNQAFAAAMATLAGPGDSVILPYPWYFNHRMWLDMQGVTATPLALGEGLLPDPDAVAAAAAASPRCRALVLVSPNNPGGAEYPPALLRELLATARRLRIALVLDETYRDFHGAEGAPHALFADPEWDDTLIHLYSFSKAFRLTGHRVGAVLTAPARLAEIEKFLDTVAICPPRLGQMAALWGLRHLQSWLAGERAEILHRRAHIRTRLDTADGWRLLGCGAYFAYAEHPFGRPSDEVARRLVAEAGILLLPGTMFAPAGDSAAKRQLRIAFANIDAAAIDTLFDRLDSLQWPRR